jgi:hypothetical protein
MTGTESEMDPTCAVCDAMRRLDAELAWIAAYALGLKAATLRRSSDGVQPLSFCGEHHDLVGGAIRNVGLEPTTYATPSGGTKAPS